MADLYHCGRCDTEKPESDFTPRHDWSDRPVQAWCKPCTAAYAREWRRKNPEKDRRSRRNYHFRSKYGITLDEYEDMVEAADGLCEICRRPQRGDKGLSVDHCHATGRIRGLLCDDCNQSIGKFEDDPERLRAAADYLESA